MSIASPTRKNLPLLSFGEWLKLVEQRKGTACVGALAADGRSRASFSNYGGWVDAYAIGRDIVNAYASGQFDIAMSPYNG